MVFSIIFVVIGNHGRFISLLSLLVFDLEIENIDYDRVNEILEGSKKNSLGALNEKKPFFSVVIPLYNKQCSLKLFKILK